MCKTIVRAPWILNNCGTGQGNAALIKPALMDAKEALPLIKDLLKRGLLKRPTRLEYHALPAAVKVFVRLPLPPIEIL